MGRKDIRDAFGTYSRWAADNPTAADHISDLLDNIDKLEAENAKLQDEVKRLGRTLTLPNGTVVERGDVLVAVFGDTLAAVRVTAVGEIHFLARGVFCAEYPEMDIFDTSRKRAEAVYLEEEKINWRPWAEAFPERPVPGKED